MDRNLISIDIIAGARPNFMKIAPIVDELKTNYSDKIKFRIVHTGQHYDKKMSGSFFEELGIPEPDINLNAGGGTQAEQTGAIMVGYEKLLSQDPSDICLVVGDVNSTMACAIVAKKAGLIVVHVEAGIRSKDLSMPEEINRMVTDSISDYFYTTSENANQNLLNQGIKKERIVFVGNTMIDTLKKQLSKLKKPDFYDLNNLTEKNYFVLTLHRPANVDGENKLNSLINKIIEGSNGIPIVFPVHPRTAKNLKILNSSNLILTEPLGYLEFNYLVKNSKAVITDSGGITEETTYLGIPCLTLRDNTERPETITYGTNELIGANPSDISLHLKKIIEGNWKKGSIPEKWDGDTSKRIVAHLNSICLK